MRRKLMFTVFSFNNLFNISYNLKFVTLFDNHLGYVPKIHHPSSPLDPSLYVIIQSYQIYRFYLFILIKNTYYNNNNIHFDIRSESILCYSFISHFVKTMNKRWITILRYFISYTLRNWPIQRVIVEGE